jgi:hypothetical protein
VEARRTVAPSRASRADTIVRFDALDKCGAKAASNAVGASARTLAHLTQLIADGDLEVPIAASCPLDQVREPTPD